jgi:cell wall-associated NlpC family hydrolase
LKFLTIGILAGSLLLGGMAAGNVEAATVSAVNGSAVHVSNASSLIENIIQTGMNLRGHAYYSHNYVPGKAMDCSGFTYYIFLKNGVDLHTKWDNGQAKLGTYVPKSSLKRGDLVFFNANHSKADITHVGVYLGNGKLLDMANSRRNVAISDMNWSWYHDNYVTARRVIN